MKPQHTGMSARDQLAAQLRALQARSGKSLKQLEATVHASDSSLSRYLSGTTMPPWPVVESLCREGHEDAGKLRHLWERAGVRGGTAAAGRLSWVRRYPGRALAGAVVVTAVFAGGAGTFAGARWFPRVVTAKPATQDQACAGWSWPPDAGQAVEKPALPAAADHHPAVTLERGTSGGVELVWAHLRAAAYGDRVWLDASDDDGRTWTQCGPFLATGPSAITRAHPLDPRLRFRACADVVHHRPGFPRDACTDFW
jgi:hypothetical protein